MITLQHWIDADKRVFRQKRDRIHNALNGHTGLIQGVTEANKEDIFYMLMFCLSVPQSKAIKVEEAIDELRKLKFFSKDLTESQIRDILRGKARFHNRKTDYLINAKAIFFAPNLISARYHINMPPFWVYLKRCYDKFLDGKDILLECRNWLAPVFKGMGNKESSHFLRNIGMGGLAILDVHILHGMHRRGLISEEKPQLTKTSYTEIEKTMLTYADKVGISIDELDFLLWSQRTGYVFK